MEIILEEKLMFIHCHFSLWLWSKVDHPVTATKLLRKRNKLECIWLRYLDPVTTLSNTLSQHLLFAWKEWMLILVAIWKIIKTLFLLYNKITFTASCYSWLFLKNRAGHSDVSWPPLSVWRISGSERWEVNTSSLYLCRNPFFATPEGCGPAASPAPVVTCRVLRCSHCWQVPLANQSFLSCSFISSCTWWEHRTHFLSVSYMKAFPIPEASHSLCPFIFLFLDNHPQPSGAPWITWFPIQGNLDYIPLKNMSWGVQYRSLFLNGHLEPYLAFWVFLICANHTGAVLFPHSLSSDLRLCQQ